MPELNSEDVKNLRHLVNEAACRRLLERYTYSIDWLDIDTLKTLFWDDAKLDFGFWSGSYDEFIPWVSKLEAGYQRRIHMFGMPNMAISETNGKADAGATMYFRVINPEDQIAYDELMFVRYQFDFAKKNDEWRMSSLAILINGIQNLPSADNGGEPYFADQLSTQHARFKSL